AIRAIRLIAAAMANAAIEGRQGEDVAAEEAAPAAEAPAAE
ncbi:MAG TPA: 30S ribosomal protein S2, partial [Clostridiales bacterium]|nr:30S ribosomal protein S2 [Clostridiales bacterium]